MRLKDAMELGGKHLLGWLNPERDYLPTGSWAITHDLARWWDAMLRLEAATGYVIPADMEGASLRNLYWLSDNPDGLLWVPSGLNWQKMKFEFHSFREGILTFAALAHFRGNTWAKKAGHRYIESINKALNADCSWNIEAFEYARQYAQGEYLEPGHTPENETRFQLTVSHGRCLEALIWFYQWTGDSLALDLADRLAKFHLNYAIDPSGIIPTYLSAADASPGDRQSHLYTLCGLLLYGVVTGQQDYIDAVVHTYQVGVPELVHECGWVAHDLGVARFSDKTGNPLANTESTGAAARLALWLAVYTNNAAYYDDVERLVRARLLPGQITAADRKNNPDIVIAAKALGGWGGNDYPHAGKGYNPSGTAEIVHTLSVIYQHIVRHDTNGLWINLHFDYEDANVQVVTMRTATAQISIVPRIHDNVLLRVPAWAPTETLALSIDTKQIDLRMIGSYVYISGEQLTVGSEIVLCYDLPTRRTVETMSAGQEYEFGWKGDEITGVYPNEQPLAFYPTLDVLQ